MTPLAPSAANLQRCGRLVCRITQIVAQCPKLHFYRSVASEACLLWDSACSGRTWPYWILLDLLFLWVWLKFPALFSTHLFLLPAKSLLSWLSLISPVGFPPGDFFSAEALAGRNVTSSTGNNNSSWEPTQATSPSRLYKWMLLKLECMKELPGDLVRRPDMIPEVWGGTQGSAFLTSPQEMSILLLHGPHFEHHILATTQHISGPSSLSRIHCWLAQCPYHYFY